MTKLLKGSGAGVLVVLVILLPLLLGKNDYWLSVAVVALIAILLVSSLRTILLINEVSLGHVGFSLIGAYGSALLMMKLGFPFWLSLPTAALLAAVIALLLSYPFLKVRGIYFSILTLLTAETLRLITYYWMSLTAGSWGLVNIPPPAPIGGIEFVTPSQYYWIAAPVVVVCMAIIYLLERSHLSFKWQAIRDADELSRSVGINVMRYKMMSFVIAAFFAGVAGALFAHFQHNLSVDVTSRFGVTMSIYLIVYLVVGGKDKFAGPIIGTVALTLVTEYSRSVKEYQPMIIGLIAIVVMLFLPSGLAGLPDEIRKLARWISRRGGFPGGRERTSLGDTGPTT